MCWELIVFLSQPIEKLTGDIHKIMPSHVCTVKLNKKLWAKNYNIFGALPNIKLDDLVFGNVVSENVWVLWGYLI